MLKFVSLALSLILLTGPAHAVQYQGQNFPDTIKLGGKALVLNGVGERAGYGLHGYSAALYMSEKAETPEEVYAVSGPKRMELRIVLSLKAVSADEFIKAINKGVGRNCTDEEKAALGDRVERLNKNLALVGKVKKGDVLLIDYVPATGTTLTVNGRQMGEVIPGGDLYTAFLKVFLGGRVSDDRLKAGLLGQPSYKGQPT